MDVSAKPVAEEGSRRAGAWSITNFHESFRDRGFGGMREALKNCLRTLLLLLGTSLGILLATDIDILLGKDFVSEMSTGAIHSPPPSKLQ